MSGGTRRIRRWATALPAAAVLITGCGSATEGSAVAADSSGPTASTTSARTSYDGVRIDVTVGDCVRLSGPVEDPYIVGAECGSRESNFTVIGKAPEPDACVSDADQTYYETLDGTEQGALCLDVDWVVDGCMALPVTGFATRIDCTAPTATDGFRVTEIVRGTDSVGDCTASDTGIEHPEREFVVCVDEI